MKLPNLTFVTHTNQQKLRAAPELEPYFKEQDKKSRESNPEAN
jgi:hypothetical protein